MSTKKQTGNTKMLKTMFVWISKASDEQTMIFANSVDVQYNQDFDTYRNMKKVRNQIGLEMLNSHIRIRTKLNFDGKYCQHIGVSMRMHEIFNAEDMHFIKYRYYNRNT